MPPSPAAALRLVLAALMLPAIAGCAARAIPSTEPPSGRWILLGDRDAGPNAETLARLAPSDSGRAGPTILDLSEAQGGLDAVVARQVPLLPSERSDLIILQLKAPDAADAAGFERAAALAQSLLYTLRDRGPVVVGVETAMPARATGSSEERMAAVRDLRLRLEYAEAVHTAAQLHGIAFVRSPIGSGARGADGQRAWAGAIASALGRAATEADAVAAAWLSGFDGEMRGTLRQRAARAAVAGQRLDVVAKIGDSITSAPAFLTQISEVSFRSGVPAGLIETWTYFSRARVPAGVALGDPWEELSTAVQADAGPPATPLVRQSVAARVRWAAADVLDGGPESALALELDAVRPGVALVMFGTNDLTRATVEEFEAAMATLLGELERRAVIPILSTIPDRTDRPDFGRRVPRFNAAVRALAAVHAIPLIDYGGAMARLPGGGLADGIHPSVCPDGAGSLSPPCLRHGYNLRNLLTLTALDRLRTDVLAAQDRVIIDAR